MYWPAAPDPGDPLTRRVGHMAAFARDPMRLADAAPADKANVGWRDRAACRNVDAELFFPIGTTEFALAQLEQARAVCDACPVQEPCLQWALYSESADHSVGVCAGLSEGERRALRRQGSRAPHVHDQRAATITPAAAATGSTVEGFCT